MTNDINVYPCRRGKVRDIYEVPGQQLVIHTTDRISAFDHVLPNEIPDKGRVLQAITLYWVNQAGVKYHLISDKDEDMPSFVRANPFLDGRLMLVKKAKVIPFECVVRGYLCGSGWKDYKKTGAVCGVKLPKGLKENMCLPTPIFTPATKAETGHDENISYEAMEKQLGQYIARFLVTRSIELYEFARDKCWEKGIIIADTKFEFGMIDGETEPILIDEVLTPDSSRYWPVEDYQLGVSIPSFDKQYVRDYLEQSGWDKNSKPPTLPSEVVENTRNKYIEACERITGQKWQS